MAVTLHGRFTCCPCNALMEDMARRQILLERYFEPNLTPNVEPNQFIEINCD